VTAAARAPGIGATPDRVFVHGRVYRRGIAGTPVEALAVGDGRITAVGASADILALAGRETEVVSLDGHVVVAGFHDAHLHLAAGSLARADLDLSDCAHEDEVARRVAERAARMPKGAWIRGRGWDHSRWPGSRWPAKRTLDGAARHHPVFLWRIDGHVAWLNSAALAAAGYRPGSADPEGGTIVRDPLSGECTGILLERAAEIVSSILPQESDVERRAAVERGLRDLAAHGVTSVEDVLAPWALPIYSELLHEGRLTARISSWLPLEMDPAESEALRRSFPAADPWIAVSTLKVFLDGTLGSRTAALGQPYGDAPETSGSLRVDPAWLTERVRTVDAAGWIVAMHAIGDRAVRVALDAVEHLGARTRASHRIEHVQVASRADVGRFAALGVAASVQPAHWVDDRHWISQRIGARESTIAYPWRSLMDHGAIVALGTDWPIASLDPMRNLVAAVTRPGGAHDRGDPATDERLTLEEAWEAYTLGSARAAGVARDRGALAPGCHADFVVLSHDPRSPASGGLDDLRVLRTYVAGRMVS
jgi:predicted amidohydrolase YtcJ